MFVIGQVGKCESKAWFSRAKGQGNVLRAGKLNGLPSLGFVEDLMILLECNMRFQGT